jgi:hypothetical protein
MADPGDCNAREDEWEMSPSTPRCRPALAVEALEDRTAPAVYTVASVAGYLELAKAMRPSAVVTADFDHDGLLDLAIGHKGSHDVSVHLATGDGGFQEEMRFSIGGSGPDALFVGDLTGTGQLDLISVALDSREVLLLAGNGDGTFRRAVLLFREHLKETDAIVAVSGNDEERLALKWEDGQQPAPLARVDDLDPPVGPGAVPAGSVIQSAAGAGSHAGEQIESEGGQQGQDFAALAASFGIPLPFVGAEGQRQALPDVFVINGPGFSTDLGVPSQSGEFHDIPSDRRLCEKVEPRRAAPAIPPDRGNVTSREGTDNDKTAPNSAMDSLLDHLQLPENDRLGPPRQDGSAGHSALADILAVTAMIGVLANEITLELSARRRSHVQ